MVLGSLPGNLFAVLFRGGKKSCVSETKGHLPDLHGAVLGGSGEEQQADEQRHQHAAQAAKKPKRGRCTHGGTSFYH